ncbi:MAG: bifunctional adenosylcobinamide kinase/adenosylcobinamide-phosphate guanylyltransferase [Spirochaetia bacterium]|nr:bifunctional adenosylcobinamide kinase/adenosylcobinamide-phosphate guanylyltransferase [Spirochaetia bacterium]
MIIFVYGGSGSGKSAFAEEISSHYGGSERYYVATMKVFDEEGKERVAKHRRQREGRNFKLIEKPVLIESVCTDLAQEKAAGKKIFLLIECLSNLVANEMFSDGSIISAEKVADSVVKGLTEVFESADDVVVVSNNVFEDGIGYDDSVCEYMHALGKINEWMCRKADKSYEVVVGIPLEIKK